MDSRRSSIRSSTSNLTTFSEFGPNRAPSLSLKIFGHKHASVWFNAWCQLIRGPAFDAEDFDSVLKLLYEDSVSDNAALHLLCLIEDKMLSSLVADHQADIVEQLIASLLTQFQTTIRKSIFYRDKLMSLTTQLMIVFEDKSMLPNLVKMLHRHAVHPDKLPVMSLSCAKECMSLMYESFPKEVQAALGTSLDSSSLPVRTIMDNLINGHVFVSRDSSVTPELLHYALCEVLKVVKIDPVLHPPSIFKSFLDKFMYSIELYQVHFLVILLKEFHLQLFSTEDEQRLLNQLTVLSKHPSLHVSYRLFVLDLVSSLMKTLSGPASRGLSMKDFVPLENDGPDTLEHKLRILVQVSDQVDDTEFLIHLKPLEVLSLEKDNMRGTKALYRILNIALDARPSLSDRLQGLIIALILASPRVHIRHAIELMKDRKDLAGKVSSVILRKILQSDEALAKNLPDLTQLFSFIEWLLKNNMAVITAGDSSRQQEQQQQAMDGEEGSSSSLSVRTSPSFIIRLFCFLKEKSRVYPPLIPSLLSCVAAAIRSYDMSMEEKEVLRDILSFVSRESQARDVTLSSWAQVYSIAISSLTTADNLKEVFDDTQDLRRIQQQSAKYLSEKDAPLFLRKKSPLETKKKHCHCDHGQDEQQCKFTVDFEVGIKDACERSLEHLSQVFAVRIETESPEQGFNERWETPLLSSTRRRNMRLNVNLMTAAPFTLSFHCEFHDEDGSSYRVSLPGVDISFREILFPLKSVLDCRTFCNLWKQIKGEDDCLETVIRLHDYPDQESFWETNEWMQKFLVQDSCRYIAIQALPSSVILITMNVIDGLLNLHLMTNDPEAAGLFHREIQPDD